MRVRVLREAGLDEAFCGMALSYYDGADPVQLWWDGERRDRAFKRARKLARMDGGHNKFLESMQVWLHIRAPRYWWSQFDTYRAGVTKQSSSTMHTLAKRQPMREDFSGDTPWLARVAFHVQWRLHRRDINKLKAALPEGFMQDRIVCTNYKALRHIYNQRKTHRLGAWQDFNTQLLQGLSRPSWVDSQEGV